MRKSKWQMAVAAFIMLVGFCGLAWAEETEMCVPMGEIVLKSLAGESQRAEVSFPHAAHFEYNCQQCHHKWDNEAPITGCSATGCHDLAEAPKDENGKPLKDALQQVRYFKNAYHTGCIGCHKEIKQQNSVLEKSLVQGGAKLAATGPTGCIQCHPKE